MTRFLITFQPVFRGAALRELRAVDPQAAVVAQLDPSVALVRPSGSAAEFVSRLLAAAPVFIRHAAPAELEVDLAGAEDP
ncbi:MAG TPA: hypothetical protein VIC57_04140, partial [Candidatus Dormibacteraeota bacterium]